MGGSRETKEQKGTAGGITGYEKREVVWDLIAFLSFFKLPNFVRSRTHFNTC